MRNAIACVIVGLGLTTAGPALGQEEPTRELPVLMGAERVEYDREQGLVIATGHVEISQDERILLADSVTFNQKTNVVTASGNVSLLEPSGEVIFADYVELHDDMKSGFIRNVRVLFPDESRLAASDARRIAGIKSEMRRAVFSPCKPCEEKPERAPLWQVKAYKVVHDEKSRDIEYYDAFLEMFGVPVAYTPYLSHPDPTVERRRGLLAPRFGTNSDLGIVVGAPYYIDIARDKDATLEPIITGKQGPVFFGEYRQRLVNGEFEFAGSITQADRTNRFGTVEDDQLRGHIFGRGRFDINDVWRWGFDVARASDDTYLQRYDFGSEDVLTTQAFLEGFTRRSYASANAFAFQGLRAEDRLATTPLVLPIVDYNWASDPSGRGAYWTMDTNLMSLTREEGADSRRLSFKGGWHLPHIGDSGHLFNLSAVTQADVYFVNDVSDPAVPAEPAFDGVTGRFFPQLAFDWRYPLMREVGGTRHVIEPAAALILGPNGGNPGDIPNEDSQAFEFEEADLFSLNRFPGLDRVDGGQRLDYGLTAGLFGSGSRSMTAFLGQSFRFREDTDLPPGSGLSDQLSDLVGRVHLSPGPGLDLLYRFRFDDDDLEPRINEVTLNAGRRGFNVHLNYLFVDRLAGTGGLDEREEIAGVASAKIGQYWSARVHARRDLTDGGAMLSSGFGVLYEDECFLFSADFRRRFTRDRELEPSDTVLFRLVFTHLGEVQL